jgi:pullulanase/glycogen debranching enzyme
VIPFNIDVNDKHKGMIDHNSYNKDNETNYINFEHPKINKDLFNYYTGLIELRKTFNAFRHTDYENIIFFEIAEHPFALAYLLEYKDQKFFVAFNANQKNNVTIKLPDGEWDVLVNNKKAGINSLAKIKDEIYLKPISGAVLKFID